MNKVLMLGWEYPPHISGGLGTACQGLTKGLARRGTSITFVVPHLMGGEDGSHMAIIDPTDVPVFYPGSKRESTQRILDKINTVPITSCLSPYLTEQAYQEVLMSQESSYETISGIHAVMKSQGSKGAQYGSDIFDEVARYAARVMATLGDHEFDVIHAHDWMTFPAGIGLAKLTNKPLVVHVHSLEYDRSGAGVNEKINSIERQGLEAANAVIAVSEYTKKVINSQHGISMNKIFVVHNGIYPQETKSHYARNKESVVGGTVLFLGRVTFQKGPDYLVEAASKVLKYLPATKFVIAGKGDMLPRLIERVHDLGIERNFVFPGFLNSEEIERIFAETDVYVMPSVSEPFGISALEAINFDTPVILSKQSGVSEVVRHALKFDFWDVERLSDLIINSLIHPELRADLVAMSKLELGSIRWDAAAEKTVSVYDQVTAFV